MFRIQELKVTVQGSTADLTAYISEATEKLLQRRSILVVPNRNYIILRPLWLATHLEEAIAQKLGVEQIEIRKKFPNTLEVFVQAKSAMYLWQSGEKNFFLDEDGFIIAETETADTMDLVVLKDSNASSVRVGQQTMNTEHLHSMRYFIEHLPESVQLQFIEIPKLHCADPSPDASEENNESDVTNEATNSAVNDSTNTSSQAEELVSPEPDLTEEEKECLPAQLVFYAPEFRLHTADGWQIYFLEKDPDAQLEKVRRILLDNNIQKEGLQYIDVRFGERVYLK